MKLEPLQYISQGKDAKQQAKNILNVLKNGAKWVQLRWKNTPKAEFKALAEQVKLWCNNHGATFIVNDYAELAKKINADGVHLGLDDMPVNQARSLLGEHKIIGATANTLQEVIHRIHERCDYIGLGPFRFTKTKEKLSPVLGVVGYQYVMNRLIEKQINHPPIYAVGGIEPIDVLKLKNTGIQGVAISRYITNQPNCILKIKKILK